MVTIRLSGILFEFEPCSGVPILSLFCRMHIAFISNYKGVVLVAVNLLLYHQICWLYISGFSIQRFGALVIA